MAHISFAEPICAELSGIMHAAAVRAGARVHRGGTYLCIEGPQFSTCEVAHLPSMGRGSHRYDQYPGG